MRSFIVLFCLLFIGCDCSSPSSQLKEVDVTNFHYNSVSSKTKVILIKGYYYEEAIPGTGVKMWTGSWRDTTKEIEWYVNNKKVQKIVYLPFGHFTNVQIFYEDLKLCPMTPPNN